MKQVYWLVVELFHNWEGNSLLQHPHMDWTVKTFSSHCSPLLMTENNIVQVCSSLSCQRSRLEEEMGT